MSSSTPQIAAGGSRERTRSCATGLVCHRCELEFSLREPVFACPDCGKGLDVAYDYELAARHFKDVPRAQRPMNIWRFEELLPIVDASAQARNDPEQRVKLLDGSAVMVRSLRHAIEDSEEVAR